MWDLAITREGQSLLGLAFIMLFFGGVLVYGHWQENRELEAHNAQKAGAGKVCKHCGGVVG